MEASQEFRGGGEIATGPEEIIQPINVDPAAVTTQAIAKRPGPFLKKTNVFYGLTHEQIIDVLNYFEDNEYSKKLIGLKLGLNGEEPLTNAQLAEKDGCAVGTMSSRIARIYSSVDLGIRLAIAGPRPEPDEMPTKPDPAAPDQTPGEPEIDEAIYFIGGLFARLSDKRAREIIKVTPRLNNIEQLAISLREGLGGQAQTIQQIADSHKVPVARVEQVYTSGINKIINSGLIDRALAEN